MLAAHLVREDVSRDIAMELQQHIARQRRAGADHFDEIAGVRIIENHVRSYPKGSLGAHLLGYVAEIDPDTLAHLRPEGYERMTVEQQREVNPLGYSVGDYWGATGIEHNWESSSAGSAGGGSSSSTRAGATARAPKPSASSTSRASRSPFPGASLRLSIDVALLQEHPQGDAAVSRRAPSWRSRCEPDASSRSTPSLTTTPTTSPAARATRRCARPSTSSTPTHLRPMLDKTMSGAFPPGSTFKPFAALAALENHTIEPEEYQNCEGYVPSAGASCTAPTCTAR